jgi:hypothetical protein
MSIVVRLLLLGTSLTVTSAEAHSPAIYPQRTLILLAAPWCAPCYREIAEIEQIAAASRPFDVRLFVIEDGERARAMARRVAPSRLWQPNTGQFSAARSQLLTNASGLPHAVAIDGEGQICTEYGGTIDAGRARRMVELCTR